MDNKNCTTTPVGEVFDPENNKFTPLASNLEASNDWVSKSPEAVKENNTKELG